MGVNPIRKGEIKRLNVDIPKSLKKRLNEFCAKEDVKIKEVAEMALEGFLDSMEGKEQD